jgi:trimeric autotransporter adhesin
MATILKTKNSVTTTVVPTTLQQGELAVNITDKKMWVGNAATTPVQLLGGGVTGDVVGPASATDNAVSRFDLTTGKLIQNSLVTISDTGAISAPVDASISGLTVGKGGGAVATNTAIGYQAQTANTGNGSNCAFGYQSLYSNLGYYNIGVGVQTLYFNTSGIANNAIGQESLYTNTTGNNNVAIGAFSLRSNTTASHNTAVGFQAAYTSTTATEIAAFGSGTLQTSTGSFNSAFGYRAAYNNTSGVENTVMGHVALVSNTTGSYNSAFGKDALRNNTTASNNTAVGYQAGYSNTTGTNFTGVGQQAGYSNTTGEITAIGVASLYTNSTGTLNTAVGVASLYSNTTGGNNVAVGRDCLRLNTTASNNIAVGVQAGYSNTTGSQEVLIGHQAGYSNSTSSGNVLVGYRAGYDITGSNNLCIGAQNRTDGRGSGQLISTGSANTIIGSFNGNQGGLDIRTASNYIVLSDGDGNPRGWFNNSGVFFVNTNVGQQNTEGFAVTNTGGGSVVMRIQRSGENNAYIGSSTAQPFQVYDSGIVQRFVVTSAGSCQNTTGSYGTISDVKVKENIVDATPKLDKVLQLQVKNFNLKTNPDLKQIGFIAQELQQVFPSLIEQSEDEDENGEKTGEVTLGVKTTVLIPILVKAIQELNAKVEAQALEIATLKGK